ncbi:unnamed protein product [Spirodela intermedia]|uniref:Uncharacterized protein n=1 Tax=Spirodela intermedia TaxID=51605 RepID=A0A7I8J158_SPIIN|nr:unnamed protein product [Spirodela intermedia]CAA6663141.1 unnamed protein product [Spirodela intermedia]
MAAALASSFVSAGDLRLPSLRVPQRKVKFTARRNTTTIVQAGYSQDAGRSSSGNIFVGGFILGGLIVGALGCIYAPQQGTSWCRPKNLMRKLPKFIYDEEKALERTRKILANKIEQLNSAIDDVSSQLRPEFSPNGTSAASDGAESIV